MASTESAFPPGYSDEYCGRRQIVSNTILLVLTTVLLMLRLYSRTLTPAPLGWDEYLLFPSWILYVGLVTVIYLSVTQGDSGRHVEAIVAEDPHKLVMWLKLLYILDWFYIPSNMLSRLSVVSLYLRIFNNRLLRAACWLVAAFLIGNCVATIIAAQVECIPLAYTWNKTIPGGRCFNQQLWYKISNIPNIVADVAIMMLPTPTVWTLKASMRRRAGIALVFLMGSVGMIASCVRTSTFFTLGHTSETDPTWTGPDLLAWTTVECGMYFSAACLVGLRPLLTHFPRMFRSRRTASSTLRQRSHVLVYEHFQRTGAFRSQDIDSQSYIVPLEQVGASEVQETAQESKSSRELGRIRVDTRIEVESLRGTVRNPYDLYGPPA